MSESNQMNSPEASASSKRKRGRPRKYAWPDIDYARSALTTRDPNPNPNHAHGAPGFTGNTHQANNPNDFMVGQAVHGVIEATFDAGYLLTVRVGNSSTVLRGVVFKPGHFVPVIAGIDIAPGVPMVKRNQVPLPRRNYGHNAQTRERNETVPAARAANPVLSKGKQVPSVENSQGILRANLVPVVLQPVNLSNGGASSDGSQAVASKGKQVLEAANALNGSAPANPTVPREAVETESSKGNQVPLQSTDANAGLFPLDDSATDSEDFDEDDEDGDEDSDDALSVEPLRSVQPPQNYGTGKMTELLQVLQAQSSAANQNSGADLGPKPNNF